MTPDADPPRVHFVKLLSHLAYLQMRNRMDVTELRAGLIAAKETARALQAAGQQLPAKQRRQLLRDVMPQRFKHRRSRQ